MTALITVVVSAATLVPYLNRIPGINKVLYFPTLLTTLVHELGHGTATVPFGGSLPRIRLRMDTSGDEGTYLNRVPFLFRYPVKVLHLLSGYSAPVLFGLFLIYCSLNQTINISGWVFVLLGLTAASAVLGPIPLLITRLLAFLASILFIISALLWAGGVTPPLSALSTDTMSVAATTLTILSIIAFLAIRSFFTFIAIVVFIALEFSAYGLELINPQLFTIALGTMLLVRGIADIFQIGLTLNDDYLDDKSDFHIAADELFFTPRIWFGTFAIFTTVATVALIRTLISGISTLPPFT